MQKSEYDRTTCIQFVLRVNTEYSRTKTKYTKIHMFDSFRRTEHRRKPNSPPLSIKLSSASSYLCFREVRSTAARPLYFVRSYTKTHTSRCVDDRFFMVTKGWTVNPKKKTVTEFGQSWFFTVRII